MTQVELLEKVLEAARRTEDDLALSYDAQGRHRIGSEHFHRAGGIKYALDLMNDPYYLRKQAEILNVLPKPAKPARDIDRETAEIEAIEKDLGRV